MAEIWKWRNARVYRLKGDKLVGNYYVAFDKAYKVEIAQLISEGKNRRRGKTSTNHSGSARNVIKWEAGDEDYFTLEKMNQWVYDGFMTYKKFRSRF
jgi:arginyl-tRNA synthetase